MYIKLNLTKCSSKYLCILLWGRIEGTLELDTFCRGDLSRLPLCCTFLHNMDLFSLVVAKILNAWSLLHFNALWDGFLLLKRCFKIINQNKKYNFPWLLCDFTDSAAPAEWLGLLFTQVNSENSLRNPARPKGSVLMQFTCSKGRGANYIK